MAFWRAAFLIAAMLAALPALALDEMFYTPTAKEVFLGTNAGTAIMRRVIRKPIGELNGGHYSRFLVVLDYRDNYALAAELADRIEVILAELTEKRAMRPAPSSSDEAVKRLYERQDRELIREIANRELNRPDLKYEAELALDPRITHVTPEMLAAVGDGLGHRPAETEATGAATDEFENETFLRNPRVRLSLRVRALIARDFTRIFFEAISHRADGSLPIPEGLNDQERREYRRELNYLVRRWVRKMNGFNRYARLQWDIEVFASTLNKSAFSELMILSRNAIQKFQDSGNKPLAISKLITEMKEIAKTHNLSIADITFHVLNNILHIIYRLEFLCGTVIDGKIVAGEIARTTTNLRQANSDLRKIQTETFPLAEAEYDFQLAAEEVRKYPVQDQAAYASQLADQALKKLQGRFPNRKFEKPNLLDSQRFSPQALGMTRVAYENASTRLVNLNELTRDLVEKRVAYYTEVQQTRPLVNIFNSLRRGYMMAGGMSPTFIGDVPIPDTWVVRNEVADYWTTYVKRAEQSQLSKRVMWRASMNEFWAIWGKDEFDPDFLTKGAYATQLHDFHLQAAGRPFGVKSSMAELTRFIRKADEQVISWKKKLGIATSGGIGASLLVGAVQFGPACWQALTKALGN